MNSVASAIWQLGPMNYSEMHYSEMLWRIKQSDIRPKRCIFRASASDKPGDRRRFRRAPLASSTGHDWLHALAGCCPSPVIGKAVWYFRDLRSVASFYFAQGHRDRLESR